MTYMLRSPTDIATDLAARAKALRLTRNLTQATLAERSGISLSSLKRFETQGAGSLDLVTRIAVALDAVGGLDAAFREDVPSTLDDIIAPPSRQRATGRRGAKP